MRQAPAVLYSAQQIHARVSELSNSLSKMIPIGDTPHFVAVLKGSVIFLADLIRAIRRPVTLDFAHLSSYGTGTRSSGKVETFSLPQSSVRNRHIVIVEDIVDTGLTLATLRNQLLDQRPQSLITVALLSKTARRRVDVPVELIGFTVNNHFVVGYGLDLDEQFRELPYLALINR